MRWVVLDGESYYDSDFSLSKMSTAEYCQDKRFELHGAAVKWSPSTEPRWYDEKELRYHLAQEDWSDVGLICWHNQFDGFYLRQQYNVRPRMWVCPMSMARLLIGNHVSVSLDSIRAHFGIPKKTTPYNLFKGRHWHEMEPAVRQQVADGACDEVSSIWRIFGQLAPRMPAEEWEVIDMTIRMFVEPELRGDLDALARVWETENTNKHTRMAALNVTATELQSAERFAALLREAGVEPEKKNGKNGDIYAFAKTDPFMERLLEDPDDRVRTLVEARLGVKSTMLQTRAEAIGWATRRGPLPVYLKYAGAHTTRWAGGDRVNYQNMNAALEGAILPPESYLAFAPDSSQIECIAEGSLVLTHDRGSVPIERVSVDDFVWDGVEWVQHEGVVCRGEKEVITYRGLRATPDHIVYTRDFPRGATLGLLESLGCGLTPSGAPPSIRTAQVLRSTMPGVQNVRRTRGQISLFERQKRGFVDASESSAPYLQKRRDRSQKQRRSLRTWKSQTVNAARKCQQSLHNFLGPALERLAFGYAGLQASISCLRLWPRPDKVFGGAWLDWRTGHRSLQDLFLQNDMAQDQSNMEKARVYDLVNAGPRYRFTVSGVLVSNCRLLNMMAGQQDKIEEFRQGKDPYITVGSSLMGFPITKESHPVIRQGSKVVELQGGFGSGGPKIEATLRRFKVPHQPGDGERWKTAYRDSHPAVLDLWKQATRMIARLAGGEPIAWGPVTVEGSKITLPNGCPMLYADLHYFKDDESGESYWRHKTRHGWAKLYGAKLVENLIQALARVVVSQAMVRLNRLGYRPLNMKHDAIWYALPIDRAEEHARVIMTELCRTPDWMPGLPLGAEGKPGARFGK